MEVSFSAFLFPFSRDPPEGGTTIIQPTFNESGEDVFPISRDPPEGGTPPHQHPGSHTWVLFPISRDPPEGGTWHHFARAVDGLWIPVSNF